MELNYELSEYFYMDYLLTTKGKRSIRERIENLYEDIVKKQINWGFELHSHLYFTSTFLFPYLLEEDLLKICFVSRRGRG